ncbi:MAG TPA: FAD binding domain-containing protein [Solirubrobacter sp.]|nr:FAD binding domain-containing protein [Solirubrobacter sp.]
MTLEPFALEVPDDIGAALRLLERHGADAAFYMGGTELLLILKLGLSSTEMLVDGKRLADLRGIVTTADALDIGAGCTHREIESSPDVRRALPALARLEARVGNPRVRNVGTLGGNLCFAEPHSDPATLLVALDASVQLVSTAGVRTLPVAALLEGPLQTAIAEAEILTRVHIPVPEGAATRVAFERIAFHERPLANAAVYRDGARSRVAVGAVCGRAVRVPAAEVLLAEEADPAAVAEAVMDAVEPLDDGQSSADYKRHLAGVAVTRCLARLDAA